MAFANAFDSPPSLDSLLSFRAVQYLDQIPTWVQACEATVVAIFTFDFLLNFYVAHDRYVRLRPAYVA